jgi:A/G-specific adenine glycosylase
MGYSRRALALKEIARIVIERFGGELPSDYDVLISLPSIGKATASSILAFAFGKPGVFIETNIRAVFLELFFEGSESVSDSEIIPLIEETQDTENPRKWYYALMDFGVYLKKKNRNLLKQSTLYKVQSPFRGSNR